jgi:ABC-2 type transport system permease protein
VADLVRMPGVNEQLRLIIGLRWSLLRNSLQRKNTRLDFIGVLIAGVSSSLLVLGICVAFFFGTEAFLDRNRVEWICILFWAIFIWWQVVPIFVAGFGANFEFRNLLRFPLSLKAFYLLGLVYGFADFAAVASLCWIASMVAAVAVSRIEWLPVMLAVCLLFVLLNVTLERLIGSWLERLLGNRRVRELMVGVFVLSMVSLNFLNPAFRRWGEGGRPPSFLRFLPYLSWLPGSLAGNALAFTLRRNANGELAAFGGLALWFAASSVLLWQRYRAQYLGEELSETPAPAVSKRATRKAFSGNEAPGLVPPAIAGVVSKEFHYLTRNGFTFLQLLLPPIMVFFLSLQFAGSNSALKEHGIAPQTFFPAVMAYLILILLSPAYNSFAFEGYGIQTYFMAPVRMRDVLMGKNLFLVLLVAVELLISLSVLVWRIGFPGLPLFLSTVTAAMFAVAGQLTIANWSAIRFPKKMEIGKMKGQRNSGIAVWTAFGVQILIGGVATVVLLAGRWTGNPWLPAILFTALVAAALSGYFASLDPLGRLAEEKKELLIETLCR